MDLAEYLLMAFFLLLSTAPVWFLIVWKRKKAQARKRQEEFPSMDFPALWVGGAGSESFSYGEMSSGFIVDDSKEK